jgi:hypothetical protein
MRALGLRIRVVVFGELPIRWVITGEDSAKSAVQGEWVSCRVLVRLLAGVVLRMTRCYQREGYSAMPRYRWPPPADRKWLWVRLHSTEPWKMDRFHSIEDTR